MASSPNARPTTLELTESESRLRDVLLGVAAYIDDAAPAEEQSAAQAPDELAKEKIVCKSGVLQLSNGVSIAVPTVSHQGTPFRANIKF